MRYYQHGDVLLHEEDSLPSGSIKVDGNVIHQGLNHAHLADGCFEIFLVSDTTYLIAREGCRLTHGEHKEIDIAPGIYRKGIVNEYDHFLEESRQVID